MRRRWVTGEALQNLLALRGLEKGDQVRVRMDIIWRGSAEVREYELGYVTVSTPMSEGRFKGVHSRYPAGGRWPKGHVWGFKLDEVIAWRPGRKQ